MRRPILSLTVALAMVVAASGGATATSLPDAAGNVPATDDVNSCASIENLTLTNQTVVLPVRNGTIEGLQTENGSVEVTVENGAVRLRDADIVVESAHLTDDGLTVPSNRIRVTDGVLSVRNVSSSTGASPVIIETTVFRVEADDEAEFVISGTSAISGEPARVLGNASFETLSISSFRGTLAFEEATGSVFGVVRADAEDLELRSTRGSLSITDATVENGRVTSGSVEAVVERGDVDVRLVTVMAGNIRVRSRDLDADVDGQTLRFDDVTVANEEYVELLERAC
jgi:hypothetical protein